MLFRSTGLAADSAGKMHLRPASTGALGGVKVGDGLAITPDGVLSSPGGLIVLRDISAGFNGTSTTFTLQRIDGSAYFPPAANSLLIFVGGIFQIPGYSYGVNSSQIIFSQAPPAGSLFYGLAIT